MPRCHETRGCVQRRMDSMMSSVRSPWARDTRPILELPAPDPAEQAQVTRPTLTHTANPLHAMAASKRKRKPSVDPGCFPSDYSTRLQHLWSWLQRGRRSPEQEAQLSGIPSSGRSASTSALFLLLFPLLPSSIFSHADKTFCLPVRLLRKFLRPSSDPSPSPENSQHRPDFFWM